jgi:hypothetical protein
MASSRGTEKIMDIGATRERQQLQVQEVFDSFGILEQKILCYCDIQDILSATVVNKRWKQAGRHDEIWKDIIRRTWKDKKGVWSSQNQIFWRSLYTKYTVQNMTTEQVLCMFRHPLVKDKYRTLQKEILKNENNTNDFLQRFVQVHMLDVMSEGGDGSNFQRRRFFSDLYFGSFASSMIDSQRQYITQAELCNPCGFEMYFKIEEEDVDEAAGENLENNLQPFEEGEGVLLYRHSTCYFRSDREFRMTLGPNVHGYQPPDLRWRWIEAGKRIQVGPYPALTVSRRNDWGWQLENLHVIMKDIQNASSWSFQEETPKQQQQQQQQEDNSDTDRSDNDDDSSSTSSSDDNSDFHGRGYVEYI